MEILSTLGARARIDRLRDILSLLRIEGCLESNYGTNTQVGGREAKLPPYAGSGEAERNDPAG
jgi:hypothetical protein